VTWVMNNLRRLAHHTRSRLWVSNGCHLMSLWFPLQYEYQGKGHRAPYPTISIIRESEQQHPSSPLIMMITLPRCL
jgi:hypothetical protein